MPAIRLRSRNSIDNTEARKGSTRGDGEGRSGSGAEEGGEEIGSRTKRHGQASSSLTTSRKSRAMAEDEEEGGGRERALVRRGRRPFSMRGGVQRRRCVRSIHKYLKTA